MLLFILIGEFVEGRRKRLRKRRGLGEGEWSVIIPCRRHPAPEDAVPLPVPGVGSSAPSLHSSLALLGTDSIRVDLVYDGRLQGTPSPHQLQ